ncbi:nucleotidyltransferase family protein [Pseudorhodoferax sp.]|uniref:nucleotidyltransferase family protein n=1 Tax=Pseudorhodoferax sp. TaxID=1993553 RepID=UPI0039E32812
MREAIVLAGGFGTRLRELVPDLPKPMAPVAGRPFLEILLSFLGARGFERVVLSLGFMADKVAGHFGDAFGALQLKYVVESQALGTGGGVRLAMTACASDHVFVFNGDTFLDLEVDAVEAAWASTRSIIIVGREVEDTARYGRLVVKDGRVRGFTEKGVSGPGFINAGCYIFPREALDAFEAGRAFSLEKDFLEAAVNHMRVDAFLTKGDFIDIGVPEDYLLAQKKLAGRYL